MCTFFFFNDTATTEIYTLSLHDALPIWKYFRQRLEQLAQSPAKLLAAETERDRVLEESRRASARAGELRAQVERSEEHTSELQSRLHLVCRLLLEKKKTDATRTAVPGET